MSARNFEFRERVQDAFNLHVTTRGNVDGAAQGIGNLAEHLGHLRGSLEIELVGGEFHAVRVAHGLSGLDAKQDFLGVRVFVVQVMAIVRGNQRDARFLRETNQLRIHALFDVQPLILNFQKEIAFAENVAQAIRVFTRLLVLLLDHGFGNHAAKASGKGNQAFAVFRQEVVVNTRLVIKAFEEASRH